MKEEYRQEKLRFHWRLLDGSWYWVVFLGGGLLLAAVAYWQQLPVNQILMGVFLAMLLLLQGLMDIRYGLLYDRLNMAIACGAIMPVVCGRITGGEALLGGIAGSGLLWLLRSLTGGGVGQGDIKLAGAVGLWLGWPALLPGLGIAFLAGGLVSVCLLLRGWSLRSPLPFGPFLAAGGYAGFLFGLDICRWYGELL